MTVTADSYEAKAIAIAANMLAASTSFRTAVGAATAAAAKAFIVETYSGGEVDGKTGIGTAMDGSDLTLATPPYAEIGLDPGLDTEHGSGGYVDYSFALIVRLVLARAGTGQTPPEGSRAAWNLAGKVRAEMQAQVGSGTAFADGLTPFADAEIASAGLGLDEDGVHREHAIAQLTINGRG
jgi:hypothetical protein